MLFVEASEIVPNLWQGSFPRPGEFVRASGFDLLVLCAFEHQEPASSYPGVKVLHAPNYDDGEPEHRLDRDRLEIALRAAQQVADVVKSGRRALVTCAAGMNRSGLVSAIALHLIFGWDGDSCVQRVRNKREHWKGYRPLTNTDFTTAIRRLTARPKHAPPGWQLTQSGVLVPV